MAKAHSRWRVAVHLARQLHAVFAKGKERVPLCVGVRLVKTLAWVTGLLLALAPQVAAAQATPAPAAAASADDKKVCRRSTDTGSIMTKRVCHTRGEWMQIDQQNAANSQSALDRRSHSLGRNGG